MSRIYFDNCLTSQPAPEVIDAMMPYLRENFYFPGSFVTMGSSIARDIEKYKQIIATSMNANPDEIHFTTGGTSANNLAIKGYLSANAHKGTHIICSVIDYPDLLTNAAFFEQSGFDVTYLNADNDGLIDIAELEEAIRPDTILVMTTLANHTMGTIQPIEKISELIERSGYPIALLVDACEAYARMPIDVQALHIDLMSISAHKIHGPQGIGCLFVRKGTKLSQIKHGINRVDALETGGISIASIAGFAKAVELAFQDLDANILKIRTLSNELLNEIEKNIPHILLNGPRGEERISHNLNVSFDYIEGEAIMMMLDYYNISVATGSACASEGLKPNYVLMATGRTHVQSHGSIKFTLCRYNTLEEVHFTVQKLKEIVQELRNRSPLYPKN